MKPVNRVTVRLAQGDVTKLEIVRRHPHLRIAVFEQKGEMPLIQVLLTPPEVEALIAALRKAE